MSFRILFGSQRWCFPFIVTLSCFVLSSCGEKKHFAVKSDDGSCVMQGVERELHFDRFDSWIFCDGNADTQAMEMYFTVGSQELKVPRKITRRIANPGEAYFSVERPSSAEVNLHIAGPNCSGISRLYLQFKDGHLASAQAHAVDADAPEALFP